MKNKLNLTRPIIFFDTETTGVNTSEDRIVQLGAVKYNVDGTTEERENLINPTIEIPKEASDIHGITQEMIEDKPTFKQYSKSMSDWFQGCDLGGYNSNSFDVNILAKEFERCGITFDLNVDFVDVFQIYKKMYPSTLGGVYKTLIGEELEDAHSAMADTKATIEILDKLISNSSFKTVKELDEFSQGDKKRVDMAGKFYQDEEKVIRWSFGKHKDEDVTKSPLGYTSWFLGLKDTPKQSKDILEKLTSKNCKENTFKVNKV